GSRTSGSRTDGSRTRGSCAQAQQQDPAHGSRVRDPRGRTGQLVVRAVSSTTKLVCSEESSTPLNFRVTVWPASEDRSKVFCAYPVAAWTLEYVARVVEPADTVSLSYAVLPLSAVSMCR